MADQVVMVRNPEDPTGTLVPARFAGDLIREIHARSIVEFENLRAAVHVLEHPKRIFEAYRLYNEGPYWCYTGAPDEWCIKPQVMAPFQERLVFSVYVNPGRWFYLHRAELASAGDRFTPQDLKLGSKGLVWSDTPSSRL